jgi:hypothetical protein
MKRAERRVVFDNVLAVVVTLAVIAALFYPFRARAEAGHPHEHQIAHGASTATVDAVGY